MTTVAVVEAFPMGTIGGREIIGSGCGCGFDNAADRYNLEFGHVQAKTDDGDEVEPHLGDARGWGRCQQLGWGQ